MTVKNRNILEVHDLAISLGGRAILDRVSFQVRRGEAVAIVGPNGAGKTTLLKCLGGILAADSGEVRLEGQPLVNFSRKHLARRISYVPQADTQPVPFTVDEFVLMGRYPYLSPFSPVSREDRLVVDRVMEQTGIAGFASRRLDTLSGGERQKVYIAAALAQGGEVMLLDEPTTFLDYHHQEDICRLLQETTRNARQTTVSVTHDVNRAALESDRIIALRDGRVVFDGPPEAVMHHDTLANIYGCSFVLVEHPSRGMPMIVPHTTAEDPQ